MLYSIHTVNSDLRGKICLSFTFPDFFFPIYDVQIILKPTINEPEHFKNRFDKNFQMPYSIPEEWNNNPNQL